MLGDVLRGRFWISAGIVGLLVAGEICAQPTGAGSPANAGSTAEAGTARLSDNVEDRRSAPVGEQFTCGSKRTCREMESCEEAVFHFQTCGLKSLARNRDGVPCVGSVCRQGTEGWEARLKLDSARDQPWSAEGLTPALKGTETFVAPGAAVRSDSGFDCVGKKYCKHMSSCKEARYRLTVCGDQALDKDGDGVPCESVCR